MSDSIKKKISTHTSQIIELLYQKYVKLVVGGRLGQEIIDPVDNTVIGFHYGETHFGSAFLLYGLSSGENKYLELGETILNSFIKNVSEYEKEHSYHWDFNNFALCCVYEQVNTLKEFESLAESIKKYVSFSKDSNHFTVNWLPMRILVNDYRYKWSGENKYKRRIHKLEKMLSKASYNDGFFDDLLPVGKSFNFQYHIFTTALLGFMKEAGAEIINWEESVKRIVEITGTDGDINYFGRGLNQIFAWGPYLYVASHTTLPLTNSSIDFLYDRIYTTIDNDNILLNLYKGSEKRWWWDYHYSSVYTAHFCFWSVLASIEPGIKFSNSISIDCVNKKNGNSGVSVIHSPNLFCSIFEGRDHYFIERGPTLMFLSSKKHGLIFKGPYGPLLQQFGFEYSSPFASLLNAFGIIQSVFKKNQCQMKGIFPEKINIDSNDKRIILEFNYDKEYSDVLVNIPLFLADLDFEVYINNNDVCPVLKYGRICGPYGDVHVYQSNLKKISSFTVIIPIV